MRVSPDSHNERIFGDQLSFTKKIKSLRVPRFTVIVPVALSSKNAPKFEGPQFEPGLTIVFSVVFSSED